MTEIVRNEIRVAKAPADFLGLVGQVYFVRLWDPMNGELKTIGTIYPDGKFAPPTLIDFIRGNESNLFIMPKYQRILSQAKMPHPSTSR